MSIHDTASHGGFCRSSVRRPLQRIAPLLALLPLLLASTTAPAQPVEFLYFDSLPAGTLVEYNYMEQGVRFLNDYAPGRFFRSRPTIRTHPGAHSNPHVLVNEAYDGEVYSSANAPLVIYFLEPTTGAGMWLGTTDTTLSCSGSATATVRIYDCFGTLLDQSQVAVSTAFNTPLEITDPSGLVSRVEIDYGSSTCPEAIDDFAFQVTGQPCEETTPPVVEITSHNPAQMVSSANQTIAGRVFDDGGLWSVRLDGVGMQFYKSGSYYYFEMPVTLEDGSNTLTGLAVDRFGNTGSDQVILTLDTLDSVQLDRFHLTQRGVMLDTSCDIDTPLVAGKSTLVRVELDVETVGGQPTYVPTVELKLWRSGGGGDTLVGTLYGWNNTPAMSGLSSPSHMSGVHFWIPGPMLDPPGSYKFEFQAYVGSTAVESPMVADCGGTYLPFQETEQVKLLIVPIEAGVHSPRFIDTDHAQNFFGQLEALARTFPVRDGYSPWHFHQTGVYYVEADPLRLCDGTGSTSGLDHCGLGWTWRYLDTDSGGELLRANTQTVLAPSGVQVCGGVNDILGGREADDTLLSHIFVPALGVFRAGAHPSWEGAKHSIPTDLDHNGDIDNVDLGHYIEEFFDEQTQAWSQNLANFDRGQPGQPGETFRFFRDLDGDNCNDADDEPQADIRVLWENQQSLLNGTAGGALDAYNNATPGGSNDMRHASIWFPGDLIAPTPFGDIGGGQGDSPGKTSWITVRNLSNLPHELGHNVGGFGDLYRPDIDPAADDLVTKESAWATYAGHQSIPPAQVFATMAGPNALDRVVFYKPNYQTLFDKLAVSGSSAAARSRVIRSEQQFVIQGKLDDEQQLVDHLIQVTDDLEPDLPFAGPYHLLFGAGETVLDEFPFAMPEPPAPPEGYDDWPLPWMPFRVVAPYPPGTEWVELFFEGQWIALFQRSPNVPSVNLISPDGGEVFGGNDVVSVLWDSSDTDGDPLRHTLYYSPDGGERWIVVASAIEGNQYTWDLGGAPGTPFGSGLLRIVVTDGFNSDEDWSDGFFDVGGKSPIAVIHEPVPDQHYLQCERVHLRGTAEDPEDQLDLVLWYLDGETAAGDPTHDLGLLPPGTHHVQLLATDLDGGWSVDERLIHVLADSDCDGMSDVFEEQHGFDPGNVADTVFDPDLDGLANFEEAWYGTEPGNSDSDGDGYTDGDEAANGSDPTEPESIPNVDRDGDGVTTHEGDCDDDNGHTYPGAPEWNDGLDNQCPEEPGHGIADEITGPAGFFDPGDTSVFSWTPQAGASRYEVARSSTRWMDPPCVVDSTGSPLVSDAAWPEPGAVFHYLVRATLPHLGSWGQTSWGAEREGVCP